MNTRFLILTGLAFLAGPLVVDGADFSSEHASRKEKKKKKDKGSGDWCDTLQDFGELYDKKTKKNPWIQKVEIFGRYHQHWIYSDGSDRGRDFNGYGHELRRLRVGASIEFLDRWKIHGRINLEEGEFNNPQTNHEDFD